MGWAGSRLRAGRATRRLTSAAQSGARAGASVSRGFGRVVQRLTRASGAGRTGLSNLIELTAAGSAGDAFVAVALAGAVFHHDTVTLLPAAFGVLVLQKAFGVTRSAVTPRLLPREITLVTANARAGLASLIASTVGVLIAGGIALAAGGGSAGAAWALRVGTVIYLAATALCFRIPDRVDVPRTPATAQPGETSPTLPLDGEPTAGGATAPTSSLDGAAAPTRPEAGRPY